MKQTEDIIEAINQYAKAYNNLENIQRVEAERNQPLIPIQDQKTGAIGEFWSMMYLQQKHTRAEVTLTGTLQYNGYG